MADDADPYAEAHRKLREAIAEGEAADIRTGDEDEDDPAKGANWGPERTISAKILQQFLLEDTDSGGIDARQVTVIGARIEGQLDLRFAAPDAALILRYCFFENRPDFSYAVLPFPNLSGSHMPGLSADGVTVRSDIFLQAKFTANGEVKLMGAELGGELNYTGGIFINPGGMALRTDRMMSKESVFLRNGFTAEGGVWLGGSEIGGQLNCVGGVFKNVGGFALMANEMTFKCNVLLSNNFIAESEVRLVGAKIGGHLTCAGSNFSNENGQAFSLAHAAVRTLIWKEVNIGTGSVDFTNARIATISDDL